MSPSASRGRRAARRRRSRPVRRRGRRGRARTSLDDRGRALGAERGQPRREDAAVRGPGRVDRLRRRPVLEVREQARGHRSGDPERARCRPRVGAGQPRGRGGCAEDPADRRRVEAARVEAPGGGHAQPGDDLGGADDRRQHLAPRQRVRLAHGQRSRAGDRRDVADRVGVRVVEVEPVAEHRVRERAVERGEPGVVPDHGRLRLAADLRHGRPALAGDAGGVRGQAAAERVQQVQLRVLRDLCGHVVERQLRRELGQPLCSGHLTPSSRRRYPGTCSAPLGRRACRP